MVLAVHKPENMLLLIFALPFLQCYNLWKYACDAQGRGDPRWVPLARMLMFLPILVLTTAAWTFAWALVLHLTGIIDLIK